MHALKRLFARDHVHHEGVRPFQVWGLRLFYLLMLVFVVPEAWGVLLRHQGPWDPLHAVAFCVWATYPALAVFGLFRPLRWPSPRHSGRPGRPRSRRPGGSRARQGRAGAGPPRSLGAGGPATRRSGPAVRARAPRR